jgi:hypothetical protein
MKGWRGGIDDSSKLSRRLNDATTHYRHHRGHQMAVVAEWRHGDSGFDDGSKLSGRLNDMTIYRRHRDARWPWRALLRRRRKNRES